MQSIVVVNRLLLCLTAVLVLGLSGCRDAAQEDDFFRGQDAFIKQEMADATMYFERYLRKNPQGEKRWYVWQQLLAFARHHWQDAAMGRAYLEIMLEEYADDPEKRQACELPLADIAFEQKDYLTAITLWEHLIAGELQEETRAVVLRKLSAAYLRRLEFTQATETLQECVRLPVFDRVKADCLYDLAITQTVTGALPEAEESLRMLLHLHEAGQSNLAEAVKGLSETLGIASAQQRIDRERYSLAVYTLADVLEQREKYKEAAELFESIREIYPNERVIELRLQHVLQKVKR